MHVGLIGNGYWGKIYLKTFDKMFNVDAVSVYTRDYKDVFKNNDIDRVIIATPLQTHFQIAKD